VESVDLLQMAGLKEPVFLVNVVQ